jgi:hypothetical protein
VRERRLGQQGRGIDGGSPCLTQRALRGRQGQLANGVVGRLRAETAEQRRRLPEEQQRVGVLRDASAVRRSGQLASQKAERPWVHLQRDGLAAGDGLSRAHQLEGARRAKRAAMRRVDASTGRLDLDVAHHRVRLAEDRAKLGGARRLRAQAQTLDDAASGRDSYLRLGSGEARALRLVAQRRGQRLLGGVDDLDRQAHLVAREEEGRRHRLDVGGQRSEEAGDVARLRALA